MRLQLGQLIAAILFYILEHVEPRRLNDCGAGAPLDRLAHLVFAYGHQSAIGVVNDHELIGPQQIV